jgi:6-phosphogluconolactonase
VSTAPQPTVERFPSAAELTMAAAERFVSVARAAVARAGRFVVVLSGGSTPRALYAMLASNVYAARVQWPNGHIFWGDERCVGPDDEASNYRMAREALLDHVPVAAAHVHRIRGEDPPIEAARQYERELRAEFATPTGAPRGEPGSRFDLVLLGLGTNGHTASLFPRLHAVREQARWVAAEDVKSEGMWRVTLTPPILNDAAEVTFLVSGSGKAAILRDVLYGARATDELPAQAIAPRDGRLRWMVDAAAAAELPAT